MVEYEVSGLGMTMFSIVAHNPLFPTGGSVIVSNSIYADNIRSFFIVVGGPHPLAHSEVW